MNARSEARPFLNSSDYEKIPPAKDGWTEHRSPATHFTLRIRCVRFSDGTTRKYYLQIERPETRREREQLRKNALKLLADIAADDASAIVRRERRALPVRGRRR